MSYLIFYKGKCVKICANIIDVREWVMLNDFIILHQDYNGQDMVITVKDR